jgi:uncharacterized protein (DUF2235 family)
MLNGSNRPPSRDSTERLTRRVREQMRPTSARGAGQSGDSSAAPEMTEWFDGIKTRPAFLPGLHPPTDDYYVPAPVQPDDMTDEEIMIAKKKKNMRRRMLL